jgi:hypothetical protein
MRMVMIIIMIMTMMIMMMVMVVMMMVMMMMVMEVVMLMMMVMMVMVVVMVVMVVMMVMENMYCFPFFFSVFFLCNLHHSALTWQLIQFSSELKHPHMRDMISTGLTQFPRCLEAKRYGIVARFMPPN